LRDASSACSSSARRPQPPSNAATTRRPTRPRCSPAARWPRAGTDCARAARRHSRAAFGQSARGLAVTRTITDQLFMSVRRPLTLRPAVSFLRAAHVSASRRSPRPVRSNLRPRRWRHGRGVSGARSAPWAGCGDQSATG
jgi:hypothetical protein